ncbi:vitamin B12 dependent-methionine synthase activation domain-containing protein [Clostridium peptidivorans]|uniref:vitamin B12 dependent-methionine synthase activation domain-containing protein n=1 Tax=Clostridium peptidivorans TaxID=100174 RepID=UPI000BE2D1CA|nr:vitamin B12 dependent-methionine synthase activation domain-containing protein [Clostridium peptidivorans]
MYIDKKEVLRYLEYKSGVVDENIDLLIDECINEIKEISNWKYIYKIFSIHKNEEQVKLLKSNLIFKGKDILEHLKNSSMCAVIAVTLGSNIDTKIRYYEKVSMTKALILDACASVGVEWACDEVQKEIRKEAQSKGLSITYRYSPGYGDFFIDIQPEIINALDAQKNIGLTVTENNILIPRKSVSAVIGFQNDSIVAKHFGCKKCNSFMSCKYRKGGSYCGN